MSETAWVKVDTDGDVAHLIFPDEVQELPGVESPVARPRTGRVAEASIAPPEAEVARAVALLSAATKPVIVVGNGARGYSDEIVAFAEHIDAPVITTFKAKGLVSDDHPLACPRSGAFRHPGGVDPHGPQRLPARARRLVLRPHGNCHLTCRPSKSTLTG